MSYNIDGFNERTTYIRNSNDRNKKVNTNFDNSFAKMRVEEHKNDVTTINSDKTEYIENARGVKDNFILMNNNLNKLSNRNNLLNNKNMFRK